MKTKNLLIFLLVIIIISASAILIFQDLKFFDNNNHSANKTKQVCHKDICFNVKIAMTNEEKSKGLMFVEELPSNEGMLFIYLQPGIYSFWMKNTLIPLDIIWINEKNIVVNIVTANPCEADPCQSYNPNNQALYVLELNAGTSARIGLEVGDFLELS